MEEFAKLSFGYWLRQRRRSLDLTQAELGRLAGASTAMIRKIEADERRPSRELAVLLANALRVPNTELAAFLSAARGVAAGNRLPIAEGPAAALQPLLPTEAPTPHNLPAPLTSFVNRVRDLIAVTSLLRRSDVRLLTLIGPPGIGKTRLSIHAAEALLPDFPDGVWFVDLASVNDPGLVLSAIARQLGVHEMADEPLLQRLRTMLGRKRILLVLDNFEQVLEAAVDVNDLLRACGGLKVLATSSAPLHVYGEHEYVTPPLALPPPAVLPDRMMLFESVQLFVARVRQHCPAFAVDAANAQDVLDILHKLEGIPLAIELAAATLRNMSVAGLAATLRDGTDWVRAIQTPARDLPPRQRTLADAIAWSYGLLDVDCQACLRRLAIFAGSFTFDAAVAVCTGTADPASRALVRTWLATLSDHNLLSPDADHWRLQKMVREFAWNRMTAAERILAQERYLYYFQGLLVQSLDNPEVSPVH